MFNRVAPTDRPVITDNNNNDSLDPSNLHSTSLHPIPDNKGIGISRPVYTKELFDLDAAALHNKKTSKEWLKSKIKLEDSYDCDFFLTKFLSFFPFLVILSTYKRSDLLQDIIAGLTVGIMHIPQGMAYGLLANLPPIYGLYTSFFPVLFYFFFGTSRHISLGTFAVVSLMIGARVEKENCERFLNNSTFIDPITNATISLDNIIVDTCKIEVAVTLTFAVGVIHLIFAVFKVGIVSEYLPSSVTRSLTCGAAFHIFTSQVTHIFGYSLGNATGLLKLVKRYIVFFSNLSQINWASVVMGLVSAVIIYLVHIFINPKAKEKIKMPVPIEFILLIIGTGISYGFKFSSEEVFNMKVVGKIPTGIPLPKAPAFDKLGEVFSDAIAIAVISFIISYSMAKLFADMEGYEIDSNQELIATSIMNMGASFFNCYVASASLSRSYVQYAAGGMTQVTGLVSCIVLLVVLMAVGPLFRDLPKCVLAAIIVVNLRNVFKQVMDLTYHFRVSIYDGLIFLVTLLAIIFTDVDIGLAIGLAFTFFSVVLRTQRPKVRTLGIIPNTDCYVDLKKFANALEVEHIKIVSIDTSLFYVNQAHFLSGVNVRKVLKLPVENPNAKFLKCCIRKKQHESNEDVSTVQVTTTITDLVFDCSLISFIDADGITSINNMIKSYEAMEIKVSLARCSSKVYRMLKKAMDLDKLKEVYIYITVHDAVASILEGQKAEKDVRESTI